MHSFRTLALAAALATVPTFAAGQTPRAGERLPNQKPWGGPAAWLIAHRTDLNLSDEQVGRLEEIQQKYDERTRPLGEKIRAAGGGAPGAMRRGRQGDLAPVFDELRANRAAARDDALALLTPEQREQVRHCTGNGKGRQRRRS
jgi:Spy/CpxP family protein refolding chaperone